MTLTELLAALRAGTRGAIVMASRFNAERRKIFRLPRE